MKNKQKYCTDEKYYKGLPRLGKFLWYLYIFDLYQDGDGVSPKINKYNPLSYIFVIIFLFIMIFMGGISEVIESWKENKLGFGYSRCFRKNPSEIKFLKRWRRKIHNKGG